MVFIIRVVIALLLIIAPETSTITAMIPTMNMWLINWPINSIIAQSKIFIPEMNCYRSIGELANTAKLNGYLIYFASMSSQG